MTKRHVTIGRKRPKPRQRKPTRDTARCHFCRRGVKDMGYLYTWNSRSWCLIPMGTEIDYSKWPIDGFICAACREGAERAYVDTQTYIGGALRMLGEHFAPVEEKPDAPTITP